MGIKWEAKDLKRAIVVAIASVLMAMNIKTFVRTGGLFPGGATGLTILIQRLAQQFLGLSLPFSIVNLLLNAASMRRREVRILSRFICLRKAVWTALI